MMTCALWKDWQPELVIQEIIQSVTSLGGDFNLPYADWNGNARCNSGTQAFINTLVWKNGFSQVGDSPTRGDALLDVYLVRPESLFTAGSIVQGISDRHVVLLEVEWEINCCVPQVEMLVPLYQKTCFRSANPPSG